LDVDLTYNFQDLPSKIDSQQEAQQLIENACNLRVGYQEMKVEYLRRLQILLDEISRIDNKILEVDIHIGKIYHLVDRSGLGLPAPVVASKERTVVIEGSEYY
jgi:hypothetical protein